MTTSVSAPLTQDEQLFKTLVWDPLVAAGEQALETALPGLRLPVLEQAEEFSINELGDYAWSWIVQFIDVTTIKIKNTAHQTAYDNASLQLKVVAAEKGTDSDDYKQALATAIADMSAFTRVSQ